MVTTVQVSDRTKRLLKQLQSRSSKSYDQIIQELVLEHEGVPRSLFGKHKNLPSWTKEDRVQLKHE